MLRLSLVVLAFSSGCIQSALVDCGNGIACPVGTACTTLTSPDATICVAQGQLAACSGRHDHARCSTDGVTDGRCYGGACLAIGCGNGRVDSPDPSVPDDVGETCDDRNTRSGDGCSADCLSDETCGNGVLDGVSFEQCDDGNLVDHDGCDSTCRPERPSWRQLSIDKIDARLTAMAYDTSRQQMVLFGGQGFAQLRGDTWLWDGTGWAAAATDAAPSARTGFAMAYDASRRRVVVFGGFDGASALGDTWEWDGLQWTQFAVISGPYPRTGSTMVYDARRKRIVMFGGSHSVGLQDFQVDETWEWNGSAWTQIMTANRPPPREGAAMSYDPVRGRIVLFGGLRAFVPQNDTFEYDGLDWLAVTVQPPEARTAAGMAWDPVGQHTVLFGGLDGSTDLADTWSWDGTAWTPLAVTPSPTPRNSFAMATDSTRNRIVVFGGSGFEDPPTTWEWTGTAWLDVTPIAPGERFVESAFDSSRGLVTMLDLDGPTWQSNGTSWINAPRGALSARAGVAMAYDVARNQTVVFGGVDDQGQELLDETWLWNGATWTLATPPTKPSARTFTILAYDDARARTVMFGGASDTGLVQPLDDTWEWNGTTWKEASPVHRPSPRTGQAMAYDPIRACIVMFGGSPEGVTYFNETWTWDGADWTLESAAHVPAARSRAKLVWNASRRRLMLFGGNSAIGLSSDTWEWDGHDWTFVPVGFTPGGRNDPVLFQSTGVITMFGGTVASPNGTPRPTDASWSFGWRGDRAGESCLADDDLDGDGLAGCADPDCWAKCTPFCPPGAPCDVTLPHCGDGTCNPALENCRICPEDCACAVTCGDSFCDAPETVASCPGDCS